MFRLPSEDGGRGRDHVTEGEIDHPVRLMRANQSMTDDDGRSRRRRRGLMDRRPISPPFADENIFLKKRAIH